MFSVQLGSALSLPLIGEVGAAGTAWLRLTAGALIFIAIARPPLRQISAGDLPALAALGVTTGLMTIMFLAAIEHIPLGTSVAIEFLGPLSVAAARSHTRRALLWPALALIGVLLLTQPWRGEIELLGIGFAIGSAVCWALYILLTQHVGERFTGTRALSITMPISAATSSIVAPPSAPPAPSSAGAPAAPAPVPERAAQQFAQAFAANKFHDDVRPVIADSVIVNLNDVWVTKRRDRTRFAAKSLLNLFIAAQGGQQHFDGDQPIQPQLSGFKHCAHSAFAQQPLYAITVGQDGTGLHPVPAFR